MLARCTVVLSPASLKRLAQERSMYSNLRKMENANQMTWKLFPLHPEVPQKNSRYPLLTQIFSAFFILYVRLALLN